MIGPTGTSAVLLSDRRRAGVGTPARRPGLAEQTDVITDQ